MSYDLDEFFEEPAPSPDGASAPSPKRDGLKRVLAVCGALLIAVAAFLAGWFGRYYALDEEVRTYLWAKSVVKDNYYVAVDEGELYDRLYATLALDPYTELFTPAAYDAQQAAGAGQNMGFGFSFYAKDGMESDALIYLVTENSPACRAGIRTGMYVVAYGPSEEELKPGNVGDVLEFCRARREAVLRCGYRKDGSDAQNYRLARAAYQAGYVLYRDSETSFAFRGDSSVLSLTEMNDPLPALDGKTAYIRLDSFEGDAAAEFAICLGTMRSRGREHLILDLRSNGGGYLDILCNIAGHLLRNASGKPVVAVAKYRDGKVARFAGTGSDFSSYFGADSRVYVLADENTASASECLIGALVDYGTVGYGDIFLREREDGAASTYGKGIMQSYYENLSGAAMKLTVATINWPLSGKCIHGVGVTAADGAQAVPAALAWGSPDVMLDEVIARIAG